ncbi:unnamed protein product, partial [Porites evermanni]
VTSSTLPGRTSRFSGVDTSLPVEDLRSVQIFLPNLNFSCKESASKCIDFGPQMRRLNSETISICGGIWGNSCHAV